jgi:hypothetical protein
MHNTREDAAIAEMSDVGWAFLNRLSLHPDPGDESGAVAHGSSHDEHRDEHR